MEESFLLNSFSNDNLDSYFEENKSIYKENDKSIQDLSFLSKKIKGSKNIENELTLYDTKENKKSKNNFDNNINHSSNKENIHHYNLEICNQIINLTLKGNKSEKFIQTECYYTEEN